MADLRFIPRLPTGVLLLLSLSFWGCGANESSSPSGGEPVGGAGDSPTAGRPGQGPIDGVGGAQAGGAGGAGGQTAGSGGSGGGGSGGDAGAGGASATADAGVAPDMAPPAASGECARTVPVTGAGDLATAVAAAMPGDCIVLGDGTYTFPMITAKGTEQSPIVIKAANTLKAVVEQGNVELLGAAYVTVQGLHFRSSGFVQMRDCDHCRISRFRMERSETNMEQDWVTVAGTSTYCRIDHNDFGPQRRVGNMIMLAGVGDQTVQHTRIDHNYFHDVSYGGGNGWELIRAGLSAWTFSKAYTVIEHNLFVRADSDPETISIKSSDNVIRYNTMRATAGQFTLRHGNRTQVYGNYILGEGRGSTGMRVYGGDHKIYNNYLAGLSTGILIDAGSSDDDSGQLTDHKVTYNVQVVFNTVVGGRIAIGSGKRLAPRNITAAYNIANITTVGGAQVRQMGNLTDGRLTRMGDLSRIGSGSPAVNAAAAGGQQFPFVSEDINGKPRDQHDTGAEELSSVPAKYGLLTPKDVGPFAP